MYNLVSFLSKLGESGKYRVPTARFVRRWQTVPGNKELAKKLGTEGLDYLVKANMAIPLQPAYSKVAGDLPIEELPVLELSANKPYSIVRFETEVLSKGNVNLVLNSTAGITAWVGQKPLKLAENGTVVELPQGVHQLTLAIDRKARSKGPLSVQLQDAANAPAQTRLIMGQ